MSHSKHQIAKKCAQMILDNEILIFILGHGINIDMGLPEIRSKLYNLFNTPHYSHMFFIIYSIAANDFWREYPDYKENGLYRHNLLNNKQLIEDPSIFWNYFTQEYQIYKKFKPNPCYFKMLQIAEALKRDNYFVLTTNYDCAILDEGFPEDRVFEAHGSLDYVT